MTQAPNSEYTAIYRTTDRFITREIAGEVLLVPVGEQTKLLNGMITFSETAAFLWKRIDGERTVQELATLLADACETDPQEIMDDVSEFLSKAHQEGLLEKLC